ncbi:sigma-54-dependent transcriptional regulator [Salinibius halmophilus]|uniref:sigma-54-dependent transcriptional regulator n=1 Tax=Salinibius halmophilus TaxID=1853216 RepID=UPI000E65EE7C|nr:sigma-54 dependent transcriptional regulator [Salinibius halmophilus]
MSADVLLIDDEPDILELMSISLARLSLTTERAACVADALAKLDTQQYRLVLTDMNLPDGNGIDIVHSIKVNQPQLPVAVITAYGNAETAVEAMKAGAFDFIPKPVDTKQLNALIDQALRQGDDVVDQSAITQRLIGSSNEMEALRQQITKVATSQAPIFINGESGTGKELVARMIHQSGTRRDGPFIAVNCGAIPEELMESEFFGHKKGAFTGATQEHLGFFQAADGGTLFLDEVAELPLSMQVKLLRSIQEKSVRPVGSTKEQSVNVRILSATHRDLADDVAQNKFRQDLFYRLHVIDLKVPPLRQRGNDVIELAEHVLTRIANTYEMPTKQLSEPAKQALRTYDFPGNVRELENLLERAVALSDGPVIAQVDLPNNFAATDIPEGNSQVSSRNGVPLEEWLADIEREEISNALEHCKWNRTEAAKVLGLTFRQLRYKLKKLEIE